MSGPPDDGSTFLSDIADKGAEAIKADPAFAAAAGDLRAFVLVYDGESAGMSYAGGHHEDYTWPRSRISAGPDDIRIWLSDNEDQEWPPWPPQRRWGPLGVPARTVHVTTDEHDVGPARHWTVKLRLAIDAEHEPEALAIAGEVIQAMDVAVSSALEVTRSAGRRPFWDIVTNLDLSAAGNVRPDDALTVFRYVIRNLPDVTFISPPPGDGRSGQYQWLPDEWGTSQNYEELAHPAVRAAGVSISASSFGAGPAEGEPVR